MTPPRSPCRRRRGGGAGDLDAILGANVATFLCLQARGPRLRDPHARRPSRRGPHSNPPRPAPPQLLPESTADAHFRAAEENLGPRPYTLLTAVFAHLSPLCARRRRRRPAGSLARSRAAPPDAE